MGITSKFYHKNILKRAADGLGDGTVYATASGATVSQAAKTFVLSGLAIIADLGADANDKFNSYILYFTSSGNVYHITDWVAATDTATVFETPATSDIGACEIRLNLYEAASNADYPVHRLSDGKLHSLWIGSGANQAQDIRIFLPNLIQDGGFESLAAGNLANPWTAQSTQWQVSATSPLLGSRMAVYTQSAADCYLKQNLVAAIEKGKTYRIIAKAQALTDTPAGAIVQVQVRQRLAPNKAIQAGMAWQPAITTTAGWIATTFTADFSSDMLELYINALGSSGSWGSCTGFRLDEVYIYEDIAVDRLIAANHNWNNGEITSVYGCRCNPGRTSYAAANDASANLAANVDIDQTETLIQSLTQSNYPVWQIVLTAASGITYEAGIIFLGPVMTFTKQPNQPLDPHAEEIDGTMNETPAGRRVFYADYYRGGPYKLKFTGVTAAFYALLKDWWQEVGRTRVPFFFCFDETSHPEDIRLVRCLANFLFAYDPVYRSGDIDLGEEL